MAHGAKAEGNRDQKIKINKKIKRGGKNEDSVLLLRDFNIT